MARFIVAAALMALPSAAYAEAAGARINNGGCHTRSCLVRVARKSCERGSITACVRRGARQWRVDERRLMRVARCESTMRPWAVNGDAAGLFQFMSGTWITTPYARRSRFSAKWSSLAAGWMFAHGRASEWVCS